jgi:hypothetical protein
LFGSEALSAKAVPGGWAELRIDLDCAHKAQLFEDRKQSPFLCAGRLCEYCIVSTGRMWELEGVEIDVYLAGKFI